ncbi:MAG: methyltransferase domain-containing protein [Bacteroidetes bacterium]|nr:methyltransferase domain-containing protein [Bacteroidota bacterium]
MKYPIIVTAFDNGVELFIPDPEQVKTVYEQLLLQDASAPFPFWAKIWASANALAAYLSEHPELIAGKHLLEIGAGIGLPSFTIAPHTASLIISDHNADAVALLEKNIEHSGLAHIKCRQLDWNHFPEDITADIVLLSDVNYAPDQFDNLLYLIKRFTQQGSTILLSTPQRIMASPFVQSLQQFCCETILQTIIDNGQEVEIAILILRAKEG